MEVSGTPGCETVQKGAGIKTNFYLKILPKQTLPKEETV